MGLGEATGTVIVVALLGALHCVGMCGGLAIVVARSTRGRIPYLLGKTATYAMLGATAGLAGSAVRSLVPIQRALSLVAGVALVLAGLVWLASGGRSASATTALGSWFGLSRLASSLSNAAGRILSGKHPLRSFAFGLANGLFPCGLVYGALAFALATASTLHGAIVMTAFGFSTAPSLLLSAWIFDHLQPSLRSRWRVIAGAGLLAVGVITILRSTVVMMHAGH